MICQFKKCNRKAKSRCLCHNHYIQEYKKGRSNNYPRMKRKNGTGNVTSHGYRRITTPDGRRMLEHRYVIEKIIGRKLKSWEKTHHIDENKLNNSLSNLELITQSSHISNYHRDSWKNRKTDGLLIIDWSFFKEPEFRAKHNRGCSINKCPRNARSFGLCQRHYVSYHRWKKHVS